MAIEDALIRAAEDSIKMRSQANLSDTMAQSLESRLKNLKIETDKQLADQQEKLMYWESLAMQREEKVMRLDRQISEMEQRRVEAEEEAVKWKRRCLMLEKTRRLGYYYPGKYMYNFEFTRFFTDFDFFQVGMIGCTTIGASIMVGWEMK